MSVDAAVRPQERFCDVGEFVVECFTADGKTYPHVGSQAVGERIVRCRECAMYEEVSTCGNDFSVCKRFDESYHITEPDGFCAWGIEKED